MFLLSSLLQFSTFSLKPSCTSFFSWRHTWNHLPLSFLLGTKKKKKPKLDFLSVSNSNRSEFCFSMCYNSTSIFEALMWQVLYSVQNAWCWAGWHCGRPLRMFCLQQRQKVKQVITPNTRSSRIMEHEHQVISRVKEDLLK